MANQRKSFTPQGIPPPSKLKITDDSSLQLNWKRFLRGWTNYEVATGLIGESVQYRCAVFMTVIGEDACEKFEGFKFEQGEAENNIATVIAKFEEFCVGTTHEAFESYRFHVRDQEQTESIDAYVAELRKLARGCNFGDQEDRMIRDRILVGCRSQKIREKLLEDSKLTLKSALEICRALEAGQTKLEAMSGTKEIAVDRVRQKKSKQSEKPKKGHSEHHSDKYRSKSGKKCLKCGYDWHKSMKECPARDRDCKECQEIGHFWRLCPKKNKSKSVRRIQESDSDEDHVFLGSITEVNSVQEDSESDWHTELLVDEKSVKFRIDTGADVTVVPETYFRKLDSLEETDKQLYGPGGSMLEVVGIHKATMQTKNSSTVQKTVQDLYVVRGLQKPLLGRPAIQALNLLQRINAVSSSVDPKKEYPELWQGLGKCENAYTVRLKQEHTPFSIATPRRLPLPMKQKVEEELKSLQEKDIIRPVTTPTDWCAPIVAVPKPSGKIRLCVDYTKLNESVRRENFPLPTTDELLAQLDGATVFSKLDCNQGFHQIPLSVESQELTTFITPFGRFCYQRLPFGISSGPEIFHREMTHILSGIQGVICDIDDILVGGRGQKEHDERLREVLKRLKDAGLTLNEKCEFSKDQVKFLGHIVSAQGIAIDPSKVEAITKFPAPEGVPELRRLLGMVNHVAKFAPNLAELTKPLRDLLKKENEWVWGPDQEEAFKKLKMLLSSSPILQHYNPNKPTMVSADASSYGIGGVLMQKDSEGWKPVFYASRAMTSTEQRYAQVEKEALAMTWICEKFSDFLIGMNDFTIETDHKPLLALMKTKQLDELTPRIQRFRMRMMRFSYHVVYTAGKNLATADALSRIPISSPGTEEERKEQEIRAYVRSVMDCLPATDKRLEEVRREQELDETCRSVKGFVLRDHWPDSAKKEFSSYFFERHSFSVVDNILLYAGRLVIPSVLRKDMLDRLHQGHQGIVKTRAFARSTVWWPGLSTDIAILVKNCSACELYRREHPQPLVPTETPKAEWVHVASDLFEWQGENYLLIVDYFSRWFEISHLTSLTSKAVINGCKSIFARMGIPESFHSDKGVQFKSKEFAEFADYWGFTHTSSSPDHQSGNGEAERAVQTTKNLLKKEKDPYLALLNYRATPLLQGQSPAELLMHRKLRTRVPILQSKQATPQDAEFRARDRAIKDRMKRNFDKRHRARPLPPVKEGQEVWIKNNRQTTEAVVQRSVPLTTPSGRLTSRNRCQIRLRDSSVAIPTPSIPKDSTRLSPDQEETRPLVVLPVPEVQDDIPEEPAEPELPELRRSSRVRRPRQVLDM